MKRPLYSSIAIIVLFFWILPINAGATIYHFANNGNDTAGNGTSGNPYKTLSKLNSINYSSGDEIFLRAGDTFADRTITLAGCTRTINGLTLRGADFGGKRIAADGKPLIDGDTIMPIMINKPNIDNLTLKDLDISGQDWKDSKTSNLYLASINGIVVDGVDFDGFGGSTPGTRASQVGKTAIYINSTNSGTIEIKNCALKNMGPSDLPSRTTDVFGIYAGYHYSAGEILIHHNIIHDANGDCIQLQRNEKVVKVYNNTLYNGSEQNIDVKHSDNTQIYSNILYYDSDFGYGGSSQSPFHQHIVVTGNDTYWAEDNIIRDNEFYGSGPNYADVGVKLGRNGYTGNRRSKVYNNYFHDMPIGIHLGGTYTIDAEIYGNTFVRVGSNDEDAIKVTSFSPGSNNQIYNNTISQSTNSLTLTAPKNIRVINQ